MDDKISIWPWNVNEPIEYFFKNIYFQDNELSYRCLVVCASFSVFISYCFCKAFCSLIAHHNLRKKIQSKSIEHKLFAVQFLFAACLNVNHKEIVLLFLEGKNTAD